MKRIVCVWFPWWPIERLAREQPRALPADRPFVLADTRDRGLVITAVSRTAVAAGLRPGMGLADARALLPLLAVADADPARDRRGLLALAHWADRYGAATAIEAPAVGPAGEVEPPPDALLIDISGTAHLYGGELGLLRELMHQLAGFGLTARPGLADTIGAASAIARFGQGRLLAKRIAAAGAGNEALAALPVAALRLSAETVMLLRRLGLKTVRDLTRIPRPSLERRFPRRSVTEAVLRRLDQASGVRAEPLDAVRPAARHEVRQRFAEPLIAADGLTAAVGALIIQLCADLANAHAAARGIVLTLHRSDGTRARITAGFSRPTRDATHLRRLVAEKMATLDAGLGIDMLMLAARWITPLAATQSGLSTAVDGVADTAGEATTQLIDRLTGRLGETRVLRLATISSHCPERAQAPVAAIGGLAVEPSAASKAAAIPVSAPVRPPLLLPTPEPIEVLAAVPEGPPQRFRWRRMQHRVTRSAGPERIAPEWWRLIGVPEGTDRFARTRDYYTVEDDRGCRFWLFRAGLYGREGDGTAPAWFMHGLYG